MVNLPLTIQSFPGDADKNQNHLLVPVEVPRTTGLSL